MRKYDYLRRRLAEIEASQPDHEYWRRWQAVADALKAEDDDGSAVAERLSAAMNHFSEWVEHHG